MNKARCELCGLKYNCLGGITTTEGYFCYDCVQRIHKIADQTKALRTNPDWMIEIDMTP